jgi:chemotaxis family two-component system response regulator Rcp1
MKDTEIPVGIMLVEDNPGDIRLIKELFKDANVTNQVNVAIDGEEALQMLHQEGKFTTMSLPDLILLDLNLPKIDGKEVLREIKNDTRLMYIPVIVLTTSQEEKDVIDTYRYSANSFITKPVDLDSYIMVIEAIQEFWLTIVKLPRENEIAKLTV